MPERAEYLFRGATHPDGTPAEWLAPEPGTAPSGPDDPGTPGEPGVPARHLSQSEYSALSPRNKERVRAARNAYGGPLYEKNEPAAESRAGRTGAAEGGKE